MISRRGRAPVDRPRGDADLLDTMVARSRILSAVRRFFAERGFVEVNTPCLVAVPDPAVHLDSFETELELPGGGSQVLYLSTSPERHMKRLVAAGMERIYQICPFFRNKEMGQVHNPEFLGLEWYQQNSTVEQCMELTELLVVRAAGEVGMELRVPFLRLTVRQALREFAGVELMEDFSDLRQAVTRAGIHVDPTDAFDDLVHRAMIERVEPALSAMGPLFLHDYPAPMAMLARRRSDAPMVAERFELYAGGLELCNGYGELCDADEQRERFRDQMRERRRLKKPVYPLDEVFLRAMDNLPPCSGCALGLDRLIMFVCLKDRIDRVMAFPLAAEIT